MREADLTLLTRSSSKRELQQIFGRKLKPLNNDTILVACVQHRTGGCVEAVLDNYSPLPQKTSPCLVKVINNDWSYNLAQCFMLFRRSCNNAKVANSRYFDLCDLESKVKLLSRQCAKRIQCHLHVSGDNSRIGLQNQCASPEPVAIFGKDADRTFFQTSSVH